MPKDVSRKTFLCSQLLYILKNKQANKTNKSYSENIHFNIIDNTVFIKTLCYLQCECGPGCFNAGPHGFSTPALSVVCGFCFLTFFSCQSHRGLFVWHDTVT